MKSPFLHCNTLHPPPPKMRTLAKPLVGSTTTSASANTSTGTRMQAQEHCIKCDLYVYNVVIDCAKLGTTQIGVTTPQSDIAVDEPSTGVCSICCGGSVRTFDGLSYNVPLMCRHIMAHFSSEDDSFTVDIVPNYTCDGASEECRSAVNITTGASHELLVIDLLPGGVVQANGRIVEMPFHSTTNSKVYKEGIYVVFLSMDGTVKVSFDGSNRVVMAVDRLFHGANGQENTMRGLCGTFDNNAGNDLKGMTVAEFANLYRGPFGQCSAPLKTSDLNPYESLTPNQQENVTRICEEFATSPRFSGGRQRVRVQSFRNSCRFSMSLCHRDRSQCDICAVYSDYGEACSRRGVITNWRSRDFCGIQCSNGMEYNECGSACPRTCENMFFSGVCDKRCIPGCQCPDGTYFDGATCVLKENCPCRHGGQLFSAGTTVRDTCRECICMEGRLSNCKNISCPATCTIYRGRSFTTFDGTSYEFDGNCEYVLVQSLGRDIATFSIFMDKTGCKGNKLRCNSPPGISVRSPDGSLFELNSQGEVTVSINNQPKARMDLPYERFAVNGAISIRRVSSTFTLVKMPEQGIELLLGMDNRIYVTAAETMLGKVHGLCGNFNRKNVDDFQLPSGSTVGVPNLFAPKWNANAECTEGSLGNGEDFCELEPTYRAWTNSVCRILKQAPFSECFYKVETVKFYKQCLSDGCTDSAAGATCLAFAAYARECAKMGVVIDWRSQHLCSADCPNGKVYKECGSMCNVTCHDLTSASECEEQCIQGCRCPDGKVFSDEENKCVAVSECPCQRNGRTFQPGKDWWESCNQCVCTNGIAKCSQRTCPDRIDQCPDGLTWMKCVQCERQCDNIHLSCKRGHCSPGCGCPIGLVRAPGGGTCIKEELCPCYHNGRSYNTGEHFNIDCNKCVCRPNENIECEDKTCPATCRSYGDPHYITYDGKKYDFQGDCRYILTTDDCGEHGARSTFKVVVQNVPCGTGQVTCTKAVDVTIHGVTISLVRGARPSVRPRKKNQKAKFEILYPGMYVVIVTEHGITVMWDRRTSVFVTVDGKFYQRTCGLCGNFDSDSTNDFRTRANEDGATAVVFGHSWRISDGCDMPPIPEHPCEKFPERKRFAQSECSKLKDPIFKECHRLVDPEPFIEDCEYDTCECNRGGDCECMCTVLTNYAKRCGELGVIPGNWRYNLSRCEFMCKDGMEYTTCGEICEGTCQGEDLKRTFNCKMSCVEGCHCIKGTKMWKDECVKTPVCPCIYDGKEVPPGYTVIEDCRTCTCKEGRMQCSGSSCTTEEITTEAEATETTPLTTKEESTSAVSTTESTTEATEATAVPTSIVETTLTTETTTFTETTTPVPNCFEKCHVVEPIQCEDQEDENYDQQSPPFKTDSFCRPDSLHLKTYPCNCEEGYLRDYSDDQNEKSLQYQIGFAWDTYMCVKIEDCPDCVLNGETYEREEEVIFGCDLCKCQSGSSEDNTYEMICKPIPGCTTTTEQITTEAETTETPPLTTKEEITTEAEGTETAPLTTKEEITTEAEGTETAPLTTKEQITTEAEATETPPLTTKEQITTKAEATETTPLTTKEESTSAVRTTESTTEATEATAVPTSTVETTLTTETTTFTETTTPVPNCFEKCHVVEPIQCEDQEDENYDQQSPPFKTDSFCRPDSLHLKTYPCNCEEGYLRDYSDDQNEKSLQYQIGFAWDTYMCVKIEDCPDCVLNGETYEREEEVIFGCDLCKCQSGSSEDNTYEMICKPIPGCTTTTEQITTETPPLTTKEEITTEAEGTETAPLTTKEQITTEAEATETPPLTTKESTTAVSPTKSTTESTTAETTTPSFCDDNCVCTVNCDGKLVNKACRRQVPRNCRICTCPQGTRRSRNEAFCKQPPEDCRTTPATPETEQPTTESTTAVSPTKSTTESTTAETTTPSFCDDNCVCTVNCDGKLVNKACRRQVPRNCRICTCPEGTRRSRNEAFCKQPPEDCRTTPATPETEQPTTESTTAVSPTKSTTESTTAETTTPSFCDDNCVCPVNCDGKLLNKACRRQAPRNCRICTCPQGTRRSRNEAFCKQPPEDCSTTPATPETEQPTTESTTAVSPTKSTTESTTAETTTPSFCDDNCVCPVNCDGKLLNKACRRQAPRNCRICTCPQGTRRSRNEAFCKQPPEDCSTTPATPETEQPTTESTTAVSPTKSTTESTTAETTTPSFCDDNCVCPVNCDGKLLNKACRRQVPRNCRSCTCPEGTRRSRNEAFCKQPPEDCSTTPATTETEQPTTESTTAVSPTESTTEATTPQTTTPSFCDDNCVCPVNCDGKLLNKACRRQVPRNCRSCTCPEGTRRSRNEAFCKQPPEDCSTTPATTETEQPTTESTTAVSPTKSTTESTTAETTTPSFCDDNCVCPVNCDGKLLNKACRRQVPRNCRICTCPQGTRRSRNEAFCKQPPEDCSTTPATPETEQPTTESTTAVSPTKSTTESTTAETTTPSFCDDNCVCPVNCDGKLLNKACRRQVPRNCRICTCPQGTRRSRNEAFCKQPPEDCSTTPATPETEQPTTESTTAVSPTKSTTESTTAETTTPSFCDDNCVCPVNCDGKLLNKACRRQVPRNCRICTCPEGTRRSRNEAFCKQPPEDCSTTPATTETEQPTTESTTAVSPTKSTTESTTAETTTPSFCDDNCVCPVNCDGKLLNKACRRQVPRNCRSCTCPQGTRRSRNEAFCKQPPEDCSTTPATTETEQPTTESTTAVSPTESTTEATTPQTTTPSFCDDNCVCPVNCDGKLLNKACRRQVPRNCRSCTCPEGTRRSRNEAFCKQPPEDCSTTPATTETEQPTTESTTAVSPTKSTTESTTAETTTPSFCDDNCVCPVNCDGKLLNKACRRQVPRNCRICTCPQGTRRSRNEAFCKQPPEDCSTTPATTETEQPTTESTTAVSPTKSTTESTTAETTTPSFCDDNCVCPVNCDGKLLNKACRRQAPRNCRICTCPQGTRRSRNEAFCKQPPEDCSTTPATTETEQPTTESTTAVSPTKSTTESTTAETTTPSFCDDNCVCPVNCDGKLVNKACRRQVPRNCRICTCPQGTRRSRNEAFCKQPPEDCSTTPATTETEQPTTESTTAVSPTKSTTESTTAETTTPSFCDDNCVCPVNCDGKLVNKACRRQAPRNCRICTCPQGTRRSRNEAFCKQPPEDCSTTPATPETEQPTTESTTAVSPTKSTTESTTAETTTPSFCDDNCVCPVNCDGKLLNKACRRQVPRNCRICTCPQGTRRSRNEAFCKRPPEDCSTTPATTETEQPTTESTTAVSPTKSTTESTTAETTTPSFCDDNCVCPVNCDGKLLNKACRRQVPRKCRSCTCPEGTRRSRNEAFCKRPPEDCSTTPATTETEQPTTESTTAVSPTESTTEATTPQTTTPSFCDDNCVCPVNCDGKLLNKACRRQVPRNCRSCTCPEGTRRSRNEAFCKRPPEDCSTTPATTETEQPTTESTTAVSPTESTTESTTPQTTTPSFCDDNCVCPVNCDGKLLNKACRRL
ncbi:mucin-2-like, partial [Patiria miniata]|uniref:Uncharacterized protein n=1 Tax=Patiria miniata TaxID=46514 RepID=A0A913YZT8_PATMI